MREYFLEEYFLSLGNILSVREQKDFVKWKSFWGKVFREKRIFGRGNKLSLEFKKRIWRPREIIFVLLGGKFSCWRKYFWGKKNVAKNIFVAKWKIYFRESFVGEK